MGKRGTITMSLSVQKDGDEKPLFHIPEINWNDVPEEAFGRIERDIITALVNVSEEWDQANLERKRTGK